MLSTETSGPRCGIARRLIACAFVLWSAGFIYRSSFIAIDGRRYFSLFDDAMISMRYAWNFSHGVGLVWNAGERVQGYTNLLTTLAMSVVARLLDKSMAVLAVQIFGMGVMLAVASLTARIAEHVFDEADDQSRTTKVVLTFFSALAYYPLAFWSLMGMETGLLSLLLLFAIVAAFAYAKSFDFKALLLVGICLGLAVLTRTDSIVAAALVWSFVGWEALRRQRGGLALGHLSISFGVFALCVAGQLVFQQWYYGEALPNTYTLKLTGMPLPERIENGLGFVTPFLKQTGVALTLAGVGVALNCNTRTLLLAALAASGIAYEVYVGGDPWNYWRMMAPTMPLVFVLVVSAIDRLVILAIRRKGSRCAFGPTSRAFPHSSLLVACTVSALLSVNLRFVPEIALLRKGYMTENNRENVNTALVLNRLTTEAATVAVLFAGTMPYYLDREAIDLLGKSDRYIAHLPPDLSGSVSWSGMTSVPGHNKYDLDHSIKALRPTYAQILEWGHDNVAQWAAGHYVQVRSQGVTLWLLRDSSAVRWDVVGGHRETTPGCGPNSEHC
jgi:arabinofuranosyltransferase